MIRSNPTAIPLRASDLKHLQSELEKRKAPASAAAQPNAHQQAGASSGGAGGEMGGGTQAEPRGMEGGAVSGRAGKSVAERIGL